MSYVKKKSVLPIYLIGVVWLLWSIFGTLNRTTDYILAALVSLAAYFLGKILFPDRGYTVGEEAKSAPEPEQPAQPQPTHSPEIQALLTERERAVSEMRRLNASIQDARISAQIDQLESTTGKIVDAVVAEPAKLPQIRRFLSYYLPTTLKLLNAYDRMDSTGVDGANISGTKGKIEDMLDTICAAFGKQLDALYGAEALDISTDITVMEQMLAREGLSDSQLGGQA